MGVNNANIGDVVEWTDLVAAGGKFYEMFGIGYCDLPTMTFRMNADGYWVRIADDGEDFEPPNVGNEVV